jgi:hypothetical protein
MSTVELISGQATANYLNLISIGNLSHERIQSYGVGRLATESKILLSTGIMLALLYRIPLHYY